MMQSPLSTVASNVTVPVMSDGRYMPIWYGGVGCR